MIDFIRTDRQISDMKMTLECFIISSLVVLWCDGVVISSGDGTENVTAPMDDPGFGNVGKRSSASVVYLGNRWVLTANHVGVGSVDLGGTIYEVESGTAQRLQNPTGMGLTTSTDLRMYRLTTDPGLPSLQIMNTTPALGSRVVMIGQGRNRQVSMTEWDVAVLPDDPDIWTVHDPMNPDPSDVKGWGLLTPRTIRWGENEVTGTTTINLGTHGDILSFYTTFDEAGLTHEAQGTSGDSGGAVFLKEGGVWKLAGIMNAVGTSLAFDGGPPGETSTNPYPYFGRVTFAADLSEYRAQIESIYLIPEPSTVLLGFLGAGFLWVRRRS